MRTHVIYARSPQWAEVAARAEDLIAGADFQPVKDEARTRAGCAALAGGARVFIKRFDGGPPARGLWERIRGSRARRSIRGAELLRSRGFRCPEPYAAVEVLSGGSLRAGYLISEVLHEATVFSAFVRPRAAPRGAEAARRRAVLASVAREVRRLHDAGLFSSDLQETNLMLEEAQGETRIHFVDLDGFRSRARVGERMRERNLVQLDRSIGRFLNRGARLRFLYAYLGERPERSKARQLINRLLERKAGEDRRGEARRARRHARAYSRAQAAPPE